MAHRERGAAGRNRGDRPGFARHLRVHRYVFARRLSRRWRSDSCSGGEIEALLTPGHSPGLLTFYFAGRKLYFSSDHMVEKITPNVGLHGHSSGNPLGDYLASLERVRELDIDWVLPSHGQPFRNHRDWICATMLHHEARCRRMHSAVAATPRTAYEVAAAEWGRRLSPLNERFAMAEALAHLEYLRRQGQVAAVRDGNLIRWRAVS